MFPMNRWRSLQGFWLKGSDKVTSYFPMIIKGVCGVAQEISHVSLIQPL